MRVVRILAIAFAAFIGIAVIGSVLLVNLFDPNDYKDEIAALLEERSGRSVEIADNIEWALFPWLAIETGGVTIGNHSDYGTRPFANVESMSARVRLWPLLRRDVVLGLVEIDGLNLDLESRADGGSNWQDLSASAETQDGSVEPNSGGGTGIGSLEIEGIRISNARVLWRQDDEVRFIVSNASLSTGAFAIGQPIDLSVELSLLDVAAQRTVRLDLETTASIDEASVSLARLSADVALLDAQGNERATATFATESIDVEGGTKFASGSGTIRGTATQSPFGPETIEGSANWPAFEIDLEADKADIDDVTTTINGISARWRVAAEALTTAPEVSGEFRLEPATIDSLFAAAGLNPPEGMDTQQIGNIAGGGEFTANSSGEFSISGFEVSLLGLALTLDASVDAASKVAATISIPAFSPTPALEDILAGYLPAQTDLSAIETAALDVAVNFNSSGNGPIAVEKLALRINEATISAGLTFEGSASAANIRGKIQTSPVDPTLLLALVGDSLTDQIGSNEIGLVTVSSDFDFKDQDDVLALSNLSFSAFGLQSKGALTVNALRTAPVVRGRAEFAAFNPGTMLRRFGQPVPQTSDPAAFQTATLSGSYIIDSAHGEFRDLKIALDDTLITGAMSVEGFDAPSYRFDLSANRLDVDRYLPPSADAAEQGERTAGDITLASDPLERLNLSGTAKVGQLKIANLEFQQVDATLVVGNGRAQIQPASTQLYGGTFNGGLAVDTGGETPTMRINGQAVGVALAPLITALTGDTSVTGTGNFDVDLEGAGASVTDTLRTAAGTASFSLTDGSIIGFNLGRTLCAAYNLREGIGQPESAPEKTNFQLIRAAANVGNGIASSPELLAKTSFLDITGSGGLNLPDGWLDYEMNAELTGAIQVDGCQSMDTLIGEAIPFTIAGPVAEPNIQPDYQQIIENRVRENVEDRLRDRLQDRLRDLL